MEEQQQFPIQGTTKPVKAIHGSSPVPIHTMTTIHGVAASEGILFMSKRLSTAIKAMMPLVFIEKSPLLSAFVSMPASCLIMGLYNGIFALWQEVIHKGELRSYRRVHECFTLSYDKEERHKIPHSILLSAFSQRLLPFGSESAVIAFIWSRSGGPFRIPCVRVSLRLFSLCRRTYTF